MHADNLSLVAIAEQFGTPSYVYAASVIREQYETLSGTMCRTLPKNRQPMICYAGKACSNIAILKLIRNLGAGLEIVSQGEWERGKAAGYKPDQIVSTGVGKSESEIAALLKARIYQINIESLPELERIAEIAQKINVTAPVVFRLNPNVKGGGHSKITTGRKHDKFGISAEAVFEGFARAKKLKNIHALGVSMHIGSQVFTMDSFRKAFKRLPGIVTDLRAAGHTVSRLDIGGGFPIQYRGEKLLDLDAYARWVRDIIVPLDTEIILEPGRFLVGGAAVLLTRTEYIKQTPTRDFVVLDAGMNDLIRPAMYDSWHEIEPVANRRRAKKIYDIVGPVCESSDFFAKNRLLPAMQQGDLAVLRTAGAYGFSMASNYNTRPLPAEILVDGSRVSIIRERQSFQDMMAGEKIPAWL